MLHGIVVEPVKDEKRFQRQPHHLTENALGGQGQSRNYNKKAVGRPVTA